MAEPKTEPVLMGSENPDGWPLEVLLGVLIIEIELKSRKIKDDTSLPARMVWWNNETICGHLQAAIRHQLLSMELLAQVGPNQGPLGKPRIGVGSDG